MVSTFIRWKGYREQKTENLLSSLLHPNTETSKGEDFAGAVDFKPEYMLYYAPYFVVYGNDHLRRHWD